MEVYYREGDKLRTQTLQHKGGICVQYARIEETSYPAHTHNFYELVIITGGKGEHFVNQDRYSVQAGDIFVLKGEDAHGFRDLQNLTLYNICYQQEKIHSFHSDIRQLAGYHALFLLEPLYRKSDTFKSRLHLTYQEMLGIQTVLTQLKEEFDFGEEGTNTMIEGLFCQLCVMLSRLYTGKCEPVKQTAVRIATAVSYMERHYTENIHLQQLADMTHLSVSQFSKIFRQVYHLSPMDYLQQLRLEKACRVLRESSMSITEVALLCGFTDSNYFSRIFKKRMGKSPLKWKQQEIATY